ncbi:hypothetical protein BV25DRAFT_1910727 [Artomyces pyxidatus]|uniref:Uncharacterized protein n=1 Tax=Artomyces pyxidatus TaxID=48021 RepID=A0ACB8TKN1_9AGAM|nr:hypothetical protein BV25DRAFT_1910727 [Artomyces pyxidatus]
MAAFKFLNLFAISTLAILATSFNASPVNALATDNHAVGRSVNHAHAALAKKKRDTSSKRCKPRTTSLAATTTHSVAPTTTAKPPTSAAPKSTEKPTTTKAVATSAAPPPPPPPPSGGKVGLGWSNGEMNSLANFKTPSTQWIYTWSPNKPPLADELGFKFLPMLWGPKQIDSFTKTVKAGYANHVLGFNEPNEPSQSNLDPSYAASLWKQYIQPLKYQGFDLITPATTNAPSGKTWMQSFEKACDGCTFDGTGLHWYGIDENDFISHATDFCNTFGRPVWITEFACQDYSGKNQQCSTDKIFSFMATVTGWMTQEKCVAAYFAFGAMTASEIEANNVNGANALIGPGNKPTALGNLYLNP